MNNLFFTIGYEGASISDFLSTLSLSGVTHLLDIRDITVSRKAGFSKTVLKQHLEHDGVFYTHLRGLGDPKPGREAARKGDLDAFRKIYTQHLLSIDALADLERAVDIVKSEIVCLLCYERDYKICHRALVAEKISTVTGFGVRHLGVRSGIAKIRNLEPELRGMHARATW